MDTTKDNVENNTEEITHDFCSKTKCLVKDCTFCQANFCVSCYTNLGSENPRQYCFKTYCPDEE